MIVLLVLSYLVPLAVGAYLAVDARRIRREAVEEIRKERESMRAERESAREERTQLIDRVMFVAGRPFETPPIWKTTVPEGATGDPPLDEFPGIIFEGELEEVLTE